MEHLLFAWFCGYSSEPGGERNPWPQRFYIWGQVEPSWCRGGGGSPFLTSSSLASFFASSFPALLTVPYLERLPLSLLQFAPLKSGHNNRACLKELWYLKESINVTTPNITRYGRSKSGPPEMSLSNSLNLWICYFTWQKGLCWWDETKDLEMLRVSWVILVGPL